jgi:hypothetical protein
VSTSKTPQIVLLSKDISRTVELFVNAFEQGAQGK